MILSKLLLLVTCCLLPIHLDSFDPYDCSFDFCQPHGSYWWKRHASYCKRCSDNSSDRIYHCARDYDNPTIFKEGCAIEKNCSAGEEPHLSFKRSGQEIEEPDVYCVTCFDKNYYNSVNKSSSTYSECPDKKWNDCSEGTHKILCKEDNPKSERFCRCDARKGYVPINVQNPEMCSTIDYECKKKDCQKLPNGKPEQRLLNYTCAPYCEEGYDRLREDSDICEPIPTMKTAIVITPNSSTKPLSTTTPVTAVPTVVPVPVEGCKEDCDEYSKCKNGTCVCNDSCPPVFKPVCGYDSKSEEYRTFSTECDLRKNFCKDRKFHLKHHGKCEEEKKWILPVSVAGGIIGFIIIFFVAYGIHKKTGLGKDCSERFWPLPVDEQPLSKVTVDGSKDSKKSTGSIKGGTTTYITKTTNIFEGTVIQTESGTNQINIGEGSKSTVRYNKDDANKEESEQLLNDSDSKPYHDDASKDVHVEVYEPKKEEVDDDDDDIHNNSVNRGIFESENVHKIKGNVENKTFAEDENNDKAEDYYDGNSFTPKIEADSGDKPVTRQLSIQSQKSTISKFGVSTSYDSLFNIQDIEDVEGHFSDKDEYKKFINKVMDLCLTDLLKYMDPKLVLQQFIKKEMFQYISVRDIYDLPIQTDRSNRIIAKVRETGEQNYNKFKECLRDTKQYDCLWKVLRVQNDVLNKMKQLTGNRCRHDSVMSQSDSDIPRMPKSQTFDYNAFLSDKSEYTEKLGAEQVPILPSQETEICSKVIPAPCNSLEDKQQIEQTESKSNANLSKVEKESKKYLDELSTILKVYSVWNTGEREQSFNMCVKMCEEIKDEMPELTSEIFLPLQDVKVPPNTVIYRNTPQGFQAYRSSGDDNSCLYQSVSLLLSGTENLQFSLRLMTAIHAVSSFKMYKKQMLGHNNDAKYWKMFFMQHMNNQLIKEIETLENAETIIDVCLKVLIMETALLGIDSSVLHVVFLCGALGINILQHFQHKTQYGDISEEVPWIKHLLGESIDVTRPDLHIFWVNHAGIVNGRLNHIVPLLKIPEDTS